MSSGILFESPRGILWEDSISRWVWKDESRYQDCWLEKERGELVIVPQRQSLSCRKTLGKWTDLSLIRLTKETLAELTEWVGLTNLLHPNQRGAVRFGLRGTCVPVEAAWAASHRTDCGISEYTLQMVKESPKQERKWGIVLTTLLPREQVKLFL